MSFFKNATGTNWIWKLINQPVCSEEREEEYERAKRRIFNEMMSPAPHYKYSISLGGTKVGDVLSFLTFLIIFFFKLSRAFM